jgi:pantothenate synthetase
MDSGMRDYRALQRQGMDSLAAAGLEPQYFAIRQAVDLTEVRPGARELVVLAAARLNSHRSIDSLPVRLIDRY